MRAFRNHVFAGAAALALAACAVPLREQLDALAAAPVCCSDIKEFNYEKLQAAELREVSLDPKSPAFQFPTGKSFFAAFELPSFTGPYAVSLTAAPRPVGSGEGTVLRPRVMLLDKDFSVTRTLDDIAFRIGTRHALVKEFFVNPSNANERYLVVYTVPGSHETENIVTYAPVTVAVGSVPLVIDGRATRHAIANAAIGKFTLALQPYEPAIVGK